VDEKKGLMVGHLVMGYVFRLNENTRGVNTSGPTIFSKL